MFALRISYVHRPLAIAEYCFRHTFFRSFLMSAILFSLLGCPAWDVRDVEMFPRYVCGDGVKPKVQWEYAGPGSGHVKIFSSQGDMLCEADADTEHCAFTRGLTNDDVPFRAEIYDGTNKVHDQADLLATFRVLGGEEDTEIFHAKPNYERKSVQRETGTVRECDADGNCQDKPKIETVEVLKATEVVWQLGQIFAGEVETRWVRNPNSEMFIILTGPGLDSSTSISGNDKALGNAMNPNGDWKNTQARELPGHVDPETAKVKLQLVIACKP